MVCGIAARVPINDPIFKGLYFVFREKDEFADVCCTNFHKSNQAFGIFECFPSWLPIQTERRKRKCRIGREARSGVR